MAIKTANNQSMSAITALPSGVSAKSLILLATTTASSSATISFTSGIDSTYKEYIFKFIDVHPASASHFEFNGSIDGGSNYNVTKTTTAFQSTLYENDTNASLGYITSQDLAQSTSDKQLARNMGNDNDSCVAGYLHLYEPSNTTFVKHFISICNVHKTYSSQNFTSGYLNTTSAVNAVKFEMASGNIYAGTFKLYGIL